MEYTLIFNEFGVVTGVNNKSVESIVIPDNITTIGEYNQEIKGETNVVVIPVNG